MISQTENSYKSVLSTISPHPWHSDTPLHFHYFLYAEILQALTLQTMIAALILLWSLGSCSTSFESHVFSNERKLPSWGWNQGLIGNLFFDSSDQTSSYNLTVETYRLGNGNDFPNWDNSYKSVLLITSSRPWHSDTPPHFRYFLYAQTLQPLTLHWAPKPWLLL